ncbi:MAG: ABC transporter substrate-binding protein [Oculatellaceae cyanobacterium bins.114]|nr:ABC transporter substrate-binding protein [Oculatellaceae cyanobacterium bins.114]
MLTRRDFTRLSLFGLGMGLSNCTPQSQFTSLDTPAPIDQTDLMIWWEQGFLPEENAGVSQLVRRWEEASGLRANLKLMQINILEQELLKAIAEPEKHQVPDVVFAISLDANLAPRLAWANQLTDVSDVLEKNKASYTPDTLLQVTYRNKTLNERHYYAIPIGNAGEYIHCWSNLLESINQTTQDIPQEWDAFWQFWQQSQQQLHAQGYPKIYGVGLCMSASGVDTFTSLRWFLDAHNATVVSNDGELVLPQPDNRQKFIDVLQEYTGFYQQGFVPPDATDWTASGNNFRFLDGGILMTHNPTLSIPLTQRLERNQYNQDAFDRYRQIAMVNWPQKRDGTPMQPRKGIKQVIVLTAGKHPEAAKDFVNYLIQPTHLNQLLKEGFKGRFLPVMPQLLSDPYWRNAEDPHLSAALKIQTQPSPLPYEVLHPAYSQILGQKVWGKTVLKVLQDNASPEQAVDWAIARIQDIWMEWEARA